MEEVQTFITKYENKIKELDIEMGTIKRDFQANLDQLSELIADSALVSFTGTGDMTEIKRQKSEKLAEIRAYDTRLKCCEEQYAIILPTLSIARIMIKNPEKYSIIIDNFTLWEEHHTRECERLRKSQNPPPHNLTLHSFYIVTVLMFIIYIVIN